jgi:hypothetical protein
MSLSDVVLAGARLIATGISTGIQVVGAVFDSKDVSDANKATKKDSKGPNLDNRSIKTQQELIGSNQDRVSRSMEGAVKQALENPDLKQKHQQLMDKFEEVLGPPENPKITDHTEQPTQKERKTSALFDRATVTVSDTFEGVGLDSGNALQAQFTKSFKAIDETLQKSGDSVQNQFSRAFNQMNRLALENGGTIDWSQVKVSQNCQELIPFDRSEGKYKMPFVQTITVPISKDGKTEEVFVELTRDLFVASKDKGQAKAIVQSHAKMISGLALKDFEKTKNSSTEFSLEIKGGTVDQVMNQRVFAYDFTKNKDGKDLLGAIHPVSNGQINNSISISFGSGNNNLKDVTSETNVNRLKSEEQTISEEQTTDVQTQEETQEETNLEQISEGNPQASPPSRARSHSLGSTPNPDSKPITATGPQTVTSNESMAENQTVVLVGEREVLEPNARNLVEAATIESTANEAAEGVSGTNAQAAGGTNNGNPVTPEMRKTIQGSYFDVIKKGEYGLIDDNKEPVDKKVIKERVQSFLGLEGTKLLYKGCNEKTTTEARDKFVKYITKEGRWDTSATEISGSPIKMSKLLDSTGVSLYKKALKEEYKSKEFRDAVFYASSKTIPGEHKKPVVLILGGCSGSGKSFAKNAVFETLFPPGNLEDGENKVVWCDGGEERSMSQMMQLVKQMAIEKGHQGVKDLDKKSKEVKKIKGHIKKAVESNRDVSAVFPETFSTEGGFQLAKVSKKGTINKFSKMAFKSNRKFVFANIEPKSEEKVDKQNFADTVWVMGNKRAWASTGPRNKKDVFTPNNRSMSFESKAYHGGFNRDAGLRGTKFAKTVSLETAKLLVPTSSFTIKSDLMACVMNEETGELTRSESRGDIKKMGDGRGDYLSKTTLISEKQVNLWNKSLSLSSQELSKLIIKENKDLSEDNATILAEKFIEARKMENRNDGLNAFRELCKQLPLKLEETVLSPELPIIQKRYASVMNALNSAVKQRIKASDLQESSKEMMKSYKKALKDGNWSDAKRITKDIENKNDAYLESITKLEGLIQNKYTLSLKLLNDEYDNIKGDESLSEINTKKNNLTDTYNKNMKALKAEQKTAETHFKELTAEIKSLNITYNVKAAEKSLKKAEKFFNNALEIDSKDQKKSIKDKCEKFISDQDKSVQAEWKRLVKESNGNNALIKKDDAKELIGLSKKHSTASNDKLIKAANNYIAALNSVVEHRRNLTDPSREQLIENVELEANITSLKESVEKLTDQTKVLNDLSNYFISELK